MLRARIAPEDVVQDTFLEAYKSLPKFEDRGEGSFYGWLTQVAHHRLLDLHKYHAAQRRDAAREANQLVKRSKEDAQLLALITAGMGTPVTQANRADLVKRLTEGLEQLPDHLREVVILRAIEERTYQEIADRLGKTPGAVQSTYCRALRDLKRELCRGAVS